MCFQLKYFLHIYFWFVLNNAVSAKIVKVTRVNGGDVLHGDYINCSSLSAHSISSNTCLCDRSRTVYTDDRNNTRCFSGVGEKEVGCSLYINEDDGEVFTLQKSTDTYRVRSKVCNTYFKKENVSKWSINGWSYLPKELISEAFLHKFEKHGNEFMTSILVPASHRDLFDGALVRISYNTCGYSNCLLLKFEGTALWNPNQMSSTQSPATNSPTKGSTSPSSLSTSSGDVVGSSTTKTSTVSTTLVTTSTVKKTSQETTVKTPNGSGNVGSNKLGDIKTSTLLAILLPIAGVLLIFIILLICWNCNMGCFGRKNGSYQETIDPPVLNDNKQPSLYDNPIFDVKDGQTNNYMIGNSNDGYQYDLPKYVEPCTADEPIANKKTAALSEHPIALDSPRGNNFRKGGNVLQAPPYDTRSNSSTTKSQLERQYRHIDEARNREY